MRFLVIVWLFVFATSALGSDVDVAVQYQLELAKLTREREKTPDVKLTNKPKWHEGRWWKVIPVWDWRKKKLVPTWHYYELQEWRKYDPKRLVYKDKNRVWIDGNWYIREQKYQPVKHQVQYSAPLPKMIQCAT